jgi:hypothetical protein
VSCVSNIAKQYNMCWKGKALRNGRALQWTWTFLRPFLP